LLEFSGTILLVSHDRRFLDNVVTSSIVFEGNGVVKEYVGGYQDWVNQGGKLVSFADQGKEAKAETKPAATVAPAPAAKPKESKLSYKQQQELEKIPKDIEKLEEQMTVIETAIAADGFYSQEQKLIDAKLAELTTLQSKLDVLYARWEELLL
ncbi:MAG: ABC transporter ATP-binding protein, partial [Pseudohongiellaceae bacterium]